MPPQNTLFDSAAIGVELDQYSNEVNRVEEERYALSQERHTELRIGLTLISLREGDITEADVDAVVCASNPNLRLEGGMAAAIRQRAGDTIQEECLRRAPLQPGEATFTSGGRLRARHVIFTAGPSGSQDEELLTRATQSALQVASDHGLATVALPAIGTGLSGLPKARCAELMLAAVVDFLDRGRTSIRRVEFCLYGTDLLSIFTQELERIRRVRDMQKR